MADPRAILGIFALASGQEILSAKDRVKQVKVMNKANQRANQRILLDSSNAISQSSVLNGQIRIQAAADLFEAGRLAGQGTGSVQANAAANAVKGASVQAVEQDIQRELQQAQVKVQQTVETDVFNLRNQTITNIRNAHSALYKMEDPYENYGYPIVNAIFGMLSNFTGSAFKFGASGSNQTSTSSSAGTFGGGYVGSNYNSIGSAGSSTGSYLGTLFGGK